MDSPRPATRKKARRKESPWTAVLRRGAGLSGIAVAAVATLGALRMSHPLRFAPAPFAAVLGAPHSIGAKASRNAFGTSQGVALREALPADTLEFPLEVSGDPSSLAYRWVAVGQEEEPDTNPVQPLAGSTVIAPVAPGV